MSTSVGSAHLDLGLNYKNFNKDLAGIAPKATSLIKGAFGKLGVFAGTAFGAKVLYSFTKSAIKVGSDVAEIQNVVDVTFGAMSKSIDRFSTELMKNFGLTELAGKKYSSTMGAMLKSTGITASTTRDMSMDLTKLTADLASFYNMDNDVMFEKLMSAMSGMPMPLKQLGINMDVASVEAYALAKGIKKSYNEMNQAEKMILRYNYLMSITSDQQGDFSRNSHNWAHSIKVLSGQWDSLKATMGQGFINILQPVVNWLNTVIAKVQVLANSFKALTAMLFGNTQAAKGTAKDLGYIGEASMDAGKGIGGAGKAAKKAGKDAKKGLAGFDEINILMGNAAGNAEGLTDGLDEIGGADSIDFGTINDGDLDIDTSKIESKLNNVKSIFEEFYNNWGVKDFFRGFREGLDLINFDNIKANFVTAFEGLGEIANTLLMSLQPIFNAAGQALGTSFKYGIATAGNLFESISLGFANFVENMKEPIQLWILETSQSFTTGFDNLTGIFEIIGQSWLASIESYKDIIAQAVEDTLTNVAETVMLYVSVVADTFEIITGKIKEFVEENTQDIQLFMDSVLGIFTDVWNLVNKVWTDVLNALKDFWDNWGKDIVKGIMDVVKDIGKWFLYLWNDLVKPVWDTMLKWITKIWDESLKGIVEELLGFVGRVGDLILKLWNGVFQPWIDKILKTLVPVIRDSFKTILDVIGSVVNGIGGIIKNLLKILNGIIDFVVGVFTGDWERAWQGISNVFKGVVDGLVAIFKIPLNLIITGINSFIRGINRIAIPDWVPGIGGKGFDISEIPHLAKGGVIDQPTLAMVGERGKEAVMPLENNTGWITELAMQIAGMLGSSNQDGGQPINLIIKIGEDTLLEYLIEAIGRANMLNGETIIPV